MFLTLPPEVGNKYLYKRKDNDKLLECEIIEEDKYQGTPIWRSRGGGDWTYWPDGKAKIFSSGKEDYVAILVEDIIVSNIKDSEELKKLRKGKEEMMNRLKELGA